MKKKRRSEAEILDEILRPDDDAYERERADDTEEVQRARRFFEDELRELS